MGIDDWVDINSDIYLKCPDCGDVYYDAPTTCTTCWCEGGGGKIALQTFINDVVIPEVSDSQSNT